MADNKEILETSKAVVEEYHQELVHFKEDYSDLSSTIEKLEEILKRAGAWPWEDK